MIQLLIKLSLVSEQSVTLGCENADELSLALDEGLVLLEGGSDLRDDGTL